MYLHSALHDGSPVFMFVVLTLLVALVMSQTVRGSGIAQHPYTKPHDGGELGSDLPPESIGRPEVAPLLVPHATPEPAARRARGPASIAGAPEAGSPAAAG